MWQEEGRRGGGPGRSDSTPRRHGLKSTRDTRRQQKRGGEGWGRELQEFVRDTDFMVLYG